jgi:hypothetical protein
MFRKKAPNLSLFAESKLEIKNYYATVIRVNVNYTTSQIYQETVNKCFTLVQKYDGDVNQFLGGIIFALWGVPLCSSTDREKSLNFFEELKNSRLPISAILINDEGLYGAFGNEARLTVTAISDNISDAIKEIINSDNGIYINKVILG